ncbi:MAG: hypothetical protein GC192_01975 [Bacteroidetes bacterium]|nr:hypothetical protein [Bacteroidota bacterium]
MKKFYTLISVFCLINSLVVGQSRHRQIYEQPRSNEGSVLLLNFSYGGMVPGVDMAERFGKNFLAGVCADYYTKNNWILGIQGDFLFGKIVKTDVLANLRGESGFVYADDGGIADIKLRERGIQLSGHVGKVFAFSEKNKRSGLRVTVGGGFLGHKIKIQDEPQVYVSSISNDYSKGYDRLANGFCLTEFIGYQFIANNRLINFSIGTEFTQGFTEGRRSFNFDTRSPGLEKRLDLLYGFRLTWTLPLFIGENPDEISY